MGLFGWGLVGNPPWRISMKLLCSPANGKTRLPRGMVGGIVGPPNFGTWNICHMSGAHFPPTIGEVGWSSLFRNKGEPGVHWVSILMCVRPQWRVCHDSLGCGASMWLKVWV